MTSKRSAVQFVSVRDYKAPRRTRIDLEHGVLDHVGCRSGQGINRENLVIIAHGCSAYDVELERVRRVVDLGELTDAIEPAHCMHEAPPGLSVPIK